MRPEQILIEGGKTASILSFLSAKDHNNFLGGQSTAKCIRSSSAERQSGQVALGKETEFQRWSLVAELIELWISLHHGVMTWGFVSKDQKIFHKRQLRSKETLVGRVGGSRDRVNLDVYTIEKYGENTGPLKPIYLRCER